MNQAQPKRNEMDICFLSSLHPPKDKRVFDKEAVSLAKAGFRVAHIAPSKAGVSREHDRGVEIRTYPVPRNLKDRLRQIPGLVRRARAIDAVCYHCNEMDSWVAGVILKILDGKKIVFDVHELYPAEFAESRFPSKLQPMVASAVRLAIRAMTPLTDKLVFAKESARMDYVGSENKHVVVQNFSTISVTRELAKSRERRTRGDRVRAVHLGGMLRERGWPQLLLAMEDPALDNIDVELIGDFPKGDDSFLSAASEAGLMVRFDIVQWLPFAEAFQRLTECDIGLLLLQPGRLNHVHALPHKLFDYMLAGLPVIAPAFSVEVARIVSEADCGILVDSSDPMEIRRALRTLAESPEERKRLGENGRRAVLERYNWEKEAEKLVETYTELFRDV